MPQHKPPSQDWGELRSPPPLAGQVTIRTPGEGRGCHLRVSASGKSGVNSSPAVYRLPHCEGVSALLTDLTGGPRAPKL